MKNYLVLLCVFLLSGCGCVLPQIPPQYVYSGVNCTAPLPDYRSKVSVVAGCTGYTLTQFPSPSNFIFNLANKTTIVTLKATGTNGKNSQVSFTVTMVDTITPRIMIDTAAFAISYDMINKVYDQGDQMVVAKMKEFDVTFPYESFGIPRSMTDSTYYKYWMLTYSYPARAETGKGMRMWTWLDRDTMIFNMK